jgi:hypothetical protein
MPTIGVDPERLGQSADALSGQSSWLGQARDDLHVGVAKATGASSSAQSGALESALRNLRSAWDFDIAAVSSDLSGLGNALSGLSSYYKQAEAMALQDLE